MGCFICKNLKNIFFVHKTGIATDLRFEIFSLSYGFSNRKNVYHTIFINGKCMIRFFIPKSFKCDDQYDLIQLKPAVSSFKLT